MRIPSAHPPAPGERPLARGEVRDPAAEDAPPGRGLEDIDADPAGPAAAEAGHVGPTAAAPTPAGSAPGVPWSQQPGSSDRLNASARKRPWLCAGAGWPSSRDTVGATSTFSACPGLRSVSSNSGSCAAASAWCLTSGPPLMTEKKLSRVCGPPWLPVSGLGSLNAPPGPAVTIRSPTRSLPDNLHAGCRAPSVFAFPPSAGFASR